MLCLSVEGTELWEVEIGSSINHQQGYSIVSSQDGGVVVTGYT